LHISARIATGNAGVSASVRMDKKLKRIFKRQNSTPALKTLPFLFRDCVRNLNQTHKQLERHNSLALNTPVFS
jgi:hypothetical protein